MATYKHLRSSTANKRPTTSIADGQLAINSNSASPGLFFKDSTGATIIKIGPVHVGTTAPNATPGAGGSSGNSTGEVWLDTSLTPVGVKIWNGSAWVNGTPTGSTTVQGLLELATDVETQTGSDTARAVTPASLQSKVSDSTSTTSSTTIASSTAVKSAFDLANAALPKSGGTVTGNLEIGTTGSLTFEGSVADGFETTIAVTNPTADRTITLPDTTGTVVTTGDTGTVTSTMLLDGTILNADVNASAAIAGTKIAPDFGSQTVQTTGIFSHALGSATAPTVTFTGDTNTGIYSPGADQVAISTAGSGRLFVDASGVVQQGFNQTPNGLTALGFIASTNSGAGNNFIGYKAVDAVGNSSSISLARSRGTVSAPTALQTGDSVMSVNGFAYDGSSCRAIAVMGAAIDSISGVDDVAGYLTFQTRSSGLGAPLQERLRITSAGLVGVGTSAPDRLLHVQSANGTPSQVHLGQSSQRDFYVGIPASSPDFEIFDASAGVSRLRITAAGNVGVGTTTASERLHVSGNALIAGTNQSTLTVGSGSFAGPHFANVAGGGSSLDFGYQLSGTPRFYSNTADANQTTIAANNSNIVFMQSAGGSERCRIDGLGRLLVGTSSARSNLESSYAPRLQIEGTDYTDSYISVVTNNASASTAAGLSICKSKGSTVGSNVLVANNEILGAVNFCGSDGSNFVAAANIRAFVDGTPGTNDMPGRLVFSVTADGASSPTPRMRVKSNGVVTTFSSDGGIYPSVSTGAGTSFALLYGRHSATDFDSGTNSFVVWSNGNVVNTNNSYGAISDIKLKENIVNANSQWDDLKALQVRNYNFKEGQTHTQIGLVAQEAELVSPGLVSESPDRDEDGNDLGTVTKSVNYSVLYMKAVKALQEAMERIEQLEQRLTDAGIA